jgi:hypothetical protein
LQISEAVIRNNDFSRRNIVRNISFTEKEYRVLLVALCEAIDYSDSVIDVFTPLKGYKDYPNLRGVRKSYHKQRNDIIKLKKKIYG